MQSITIENSNDAVRLQLSDGTSISGIISNLNNFIVVVEDENGTEWNRNLNLYWGYCGLRFGSV